MLFWSTKINGETIDVMLGVDRHPPRPASCQRRFLQDSFCFRPVYAAAYQLKLSCTRAPEARAALQKISLCRRVLGRRSGQDALVVGQPRTDADAERADVEQADILAVVARPDLHHGDHPAELPLQFDIALHHDGVGQERSEE